MEEPPPLQYGDRILTEEYSPETVDQGVIVHRQIPAHRVSQSSEDIFVIRDFSLTFREIEMSSTFSFE